MEMKWMADEVFLLPSQKDRGGCDPNCELQVKALPRSSPSLLFLSSFPQPFLPHRTLLHNKRHFLKRGVAFFCIRGVTVATRWYVAWIGYKAVGASLESDKRGAAALRKDLFFSFIFFV